jgi:hypothetical protein
MIRRLAWFAVLFVAAASALIVARHVPPDDGGWLPAGLLFIAVTALALRRRTA